MANEEHFEELKKGVESWNQWRSVNVEVQPDLSNANLSNANLSSANLSSADLSKTRLFSANLSDANLFSANLGDAHLLRADLSNANLSKTNLLRADLLRANLSNADLSSANLSSADLSSADLSSANLSNGNLSSANLIGTNLSDANLIGTNLISADLRSANLRNGNLRNVNLFSADLFSADLSNADLSNADLSNADLSSANLSNADLSNADLSAAQFLQSNLTYAILTGACIQDWNINNGTQLEGVVCEYIYLKRSWSKEKRNFLLIDRRPSDPNAIFAPGEFTKLYQKALDTVDLIFADGIDWKAFFQSFQDLQTQYNDNSLSIQAIEKKGGGAFVVRLEIPPDADKAEVERTARERYTQQLAVLEASYQAQLRIQGETLEHERQRNSQLMRVVEVMAENTGPKYDLRHANIGNVANTVKDNACQQANQTIHTSPEKQSLAEAAAEIQKLLKQLEQSNPTATPEQQQAFVTAALPAPLRQRAVSALQSGGKAALQEFLDNPYVNVAIAIIEGWKDATPSP